MKSLILGLALSAAFIARAAEPLARDASVYARPDPSAVVIHHLSAGTTPAEATAPEKTEGWLAVEISGPHNFYVENHHVGKNLDIKVGSPLRLSPEISAPVVATMQLGTKAELTGLRGDWTLYRVEQSATGYIKLPSVAATATSQPTTATTTATQTSDLSDPTADMPRYFEGRFGPTKNFLGFKHPYNFQILDTAGNRFAYLDISRLMLTESTERFYDRIVIVYGVARKLDNNRGIVLEVQTLHLK